MSSSQLSPTMRAAGVLLLALIFFPTGGRASLRIDLNGSWQFRTDASKAGETQGWAKEIPSGTETVRVPHTWSIGKYDDYEGTAWYFKTFEIPDELRSKHVELHFGATFYISRVWLNGVEIGGHEGGYTEYWFDVTPQLKRVNFLALEINNQPTVQSIPAWALKPIGTKLIWYDFWHYGGIVRDVWLSVNESAMIRRQQIRAKVVADSAEVTDRVFLENSSKKPAPVKVVIKAWPPEGGPAAGAAEKELTLTSGKQDATLDLRIDPVIRWDFDHPNVYRMEVQLLDTRGNLLDSVADNFGARTIELHGRRLYLNGEPVRLTGMARHEDSPWAGLAETTDTILHDYDDMKSLHMTLARPVHYPQHPITLDYCDRNGILLIPEIPVYNVIERQLLDPKLIALAKQMMREMIEQDFNHPSIFAWSTCNESATNTPGGKAYFKTMYDFIKVLDPDRYVSYADNLITSTANPNDNAASIADFVMWNAYFPTDLLPSALERVNRDYPDKTVIISEFGVANYFTPNSEAGDKLRQRVFHDQMEMFGKQDWIAGALMWSYQDYKSHHDLWPGETEGWVNTGVVDENRQRRPSYYVWRELNSPAHITLEWQYAPNGVSGFHAKIERRRPDEIPSYTLRGYRVTWEVRDNDGTKLVGDEKILPDVGPPQTLEASWPVAASKSLRLTLRLYRPTGFVAAEKNLDWWDIRPAGLSVDEMKRRGLPVPE